jgi:thiol-disulfide isomerase/thioredoxin
MQGKTPPRRQLHKPLGLLAVAMVLLTAAACTGKNAVDTGPGDRLGLQGGAIHVIDLAGHDFHVGRVSGTSLTGSHVSLADLPGKLKVVNFWGSWCAPCQAEAQGFATLARQVAPRGVSFLGIDERENGTSAGLAFERQYHVPYPSIYDRDESFLLAFPGAVPATTPTTILVSSSGHILAKVSGPVEYTQLRALVNHYLAVAT